MFDVQLLKGKKIVVTGGGTGLGKSMATRFAELGADLVITSRRQNVIDETAKDLREHGVKVLAISCDVRDTEQVESMVEQTVSEFGTIDILITRTTKPVKPGVSGNHELTADFSRLLGRKCPEVDGRQQRPKWH